MADFLLLRGEDHLVLGVRWTGMTVDGQVLRAGPDALLTLLFPPQHLAEELTVPGVPAPAYRPSGGNPDVVPVWRATPAAPSRITVVVEQGAVVPLTTIALLAAVAARPLADSVVEVPWRLRFTVDGDDVRAVHENQPANAGGVTGLWRTNLTSGSGLRLRPVDHAAAHYPDLFATPIGEAQRSLIIQNGPAAASRLELSALGATATIRARWPNLDWDQRIVLGRDMEVRLLARGVLYPLGHHADYVEHTERIYDPHLGASVLRRTLTLAITDPVRPAPADPRLRRSFPFDDVVITRTLHTDIGVPEWLPDRSSPRCFWPRYGTDPIRFPVELHTARGPVRTELPLLFVAGDALDDPRVPGFYGEQSVSLPGVPVDLIRGARPADEDVHEVHSLTFAGTTADGFRPRLTGAEVVLPALRSLLGDGARRGIAFTDAYLDTGTATDVVFRVVGPEIPLSFTRNSDRSGALVAPNYSADALSRVHGPVKLAGLPAADGVINPAALFGPDATVLGFRLRDLLTGLRVPPRVTSVLEPGRPPTVRMLWKDIALRSVGAFIANPGARIDLSVEGPTTTCVVRDFALAFPPGPGAVLRLDFGSLTYTQRAGERPSLDVAGLDATFLGTLKLLQELQNAVDLGSARPLLDVTPSGITVRYALSVPSVSAGVFVLRDIVLRIAIEVPFDGKPVWVSLSFAERQNPFALSVLMFGGGGYVEVAFDRDGLKRLEAALEFGAIVSVDFLVASGEVHALGGVRFALEAGGSVTLTGYLRVGGCVEVLGIVSVSIEMRIELTYQSARNALVGRASIVVEIDLTLWSDSVEIDSGEWVLAGGSAPQRTRSLLAGLEADTGLDRWRSYRAAFAHDSRGGTP
ncbi:hypothetical protein [Umezawaea sp. NPDC059074]|uniref:hypothetical protein n=1 Tax=Umezawaea sp. NPDC059074 TaxID=3346716 RepID=UPI0036CEC7E4